MSESTPAFVLLRRVASRLQLASIGRRSYVAFLVVCTLYAVLVLLRKLLGLVEIPDWLFDPVILLAFPAAAVLLGLVASRRPGDTEAARAVDRQTGTKDLFLTLTLLDKSVGDYKPLVARDAEVQAPKIKPVEVVPFAVGQRLAVTAAVLIAVLLLPYLPSLDPLGKEAEAKESQQQQQKLVDSKKATELRAAELKRDDKEGEVSNEVAKAIEDLKSTLLKTKPLERQQNFEALQGHQKSLGERFMKVSTGDLKNLLRQTPMSQRFGGADQAKLQKWTRELQEGSTESLQKEMKQMQGDLERLMKTKDPVERAELARTLQKKINELHDFASKNVDSKPLSAALERASKQLEMAKSEGLSTEALEAMSKSLDLTKLELQEIAQSAKDLKALDEALKTLQMANKLNAQGKLDGEQCEGCESMSDYADFYAEMMAQMGDEGGEGDGLGGRGQGRGGEAPEDDSVATNFKSERSKSAITAGKVLLSLKSKGLSDTGDAEQNYRQLVRDVKQGVSEAIELEQIPPGYVDGIKKYFDSIDPPAQPSADE